MRIHQKLAAAIFPVIIVVIFGAAFIDDPWRLLWYPIVGVGAAAFIYCQWQAMNALDAWRAQRKQRAFDADYSAALEAERRKAAVS